ncbi:phage tail tube protein [Vibrio europaeus]|uniref:phage tail tube protein n=1 Tax=Vibrio europaeus TaxID=300876 RepID=UPI00233EC915|nr:phage tail tube protein [Vibrio europaeus]MDC5753861.1 phage tail tube protein [Vibrio europaeus]MDC5776773.1 phage tail tube protein [Vibrio europaeus]MDC5796789.1 phage tail tube protein [Vibrio europaeus]MDC5801786.1 phage tail tube protein [Vibrio europaeus]MDC5815759.1 phage tail tube protein [Vibrio europaeus]
MILGEATIRANGVELKTVGEATFNPGGFERKVLTGGGKARGQSEKFVAPSLQCDLAADEDVDVIDINAMRNATVTFEGNNGVSYMMTGSALEQPVAVGTEGTIPGCNWIGLKAKKM